MAFGRYVRESGLAIPPVILIFGSYWLFPLVTALVAGDIVAAEDHNGTLKTILTRSVGRGRIFAAKALAAFTYALVALVAMGVVAVAGGVLKSGFNPLVSLSGTTVSPGRGLALIGASLAVYMLPLLAVASIALLLSTVTHNSAAAVVGALMISLLHAADHDHPGPRAACSPTCCRPSSTPGRACCARRSTARRSSARRGSARSTRSRAWARPSWPSCAATSPAGDGQARPKA